MAIILGTQHGLPCVPNTVDDNFSDGLRVTADGGALSRP